MKPFPTPSDERTASFKRRAGRRIHKPHHGASRKKFRRCGSWNWHSSTTRRFLEVLAAERAYLAAPDAFLCWDALQDLTSEAVASIAEWHGVRVHRWTSVTMLLLVDRRWPGSWATRSLQEHAQAGRLA